MAPEEHKKLPTLGDMFRASKESEGLARFNDGLHEVMMAKKPDDLPAPEILFLKTPLYTRYNLDPDKLMEIGRIEGFHGVVDSYCLGCRKDSQFNGSNDSAYFDESYLLRPRIFAVTLVCNRNNLHIMEFIFKYADNELIKIGQLPSVADLTTHELKKYAKILGEQKFKEFKTGIGLASHGVGIGAFVYLRRIFEDQIRHAHEEAKKDKGWNEEEYKSAIRMEDKILALREHLPEFLVEHRAMYGILSKGVHDLTDEECNLYFETIRDGIEIILDAKLEAMKKKTKLASASKRIGAIQEKLKPTK